jgi:hypothetical protein
MGVPPEVMIAVGRGRSPAIAGSDEIAVVMLFEGNDGLLREFSAEFLGVIVEFLGELPPLMCSKPG